MADIKVILKIHETGNGTIDHVYTSVPTNNVSELPFSTDVVDWLNNLGSSNKFSNGNELNPIGQLQLDSSTKGFIGVRNDTSSEQYNGLMFGYTNASSQFALTLTFQGTDMGNLKIVFDKTQQNYPTSYTVIETNGTTSTTHTYTNASVELQLTGVSGNADAIELQFNTWSKANAIVGITFIENQVIDVPLDKSYVVSFETQNQITSSPQTADYGVLANTGTIKLKDKNKLLYNYVEIGYLKMNAFGVEIYVNGKMIQKHIVTDSPRYSADGYMEINLTNIIEKMNNNLPDITYQANTTLYSIFVDIMRRSGYDDDYSTTEIDAMLQNSFFGCVSTEQTFESIFKATTIQSQMILKSGSLRDQIQKICQATRSYFYQDDNGQLTFTYATTGVNDFIYPFADAKCEISSFSYDILTSNQYDIVLFGETNEKSNNKNILEYGTNELLEANLKVYKVIEEGISWIEFYFKDFIRSNILYEYQLGIKSGSVECIPIDIFYYELEQKHYLKEWAKGEMFNTGEILDYISGSPIDNKTDTIGSVAGNKVRCLMKWRIVGRTVKYDGQVTLSLSVRECMQHAGRRL